MLNRDSVLSGGQANKNAFTHGMSAPGQSVEQAQSKFNDFVSMNEDQATQTQVDFWLAGIPGLSDVALAQFAVALQCRCRLDFADACWIPGLEMVEPIEGRLW